MPSELTRSEVLNGLSQEVIYLPNGDSLALIGDTWYHGTDERDAWMPLAGVAAQLADAYTHQLRRLTEKGHV